MAATKTRYAAPAILIAGAGFGTGLALAALVWRAHPRNSDSQSSTLPPTPVPSGQAALSPPPSPATTAPTDARQSMPQNPAEGIRFDTPGLSPLAEKDVAGQRRNYKAGYLHRLWVRANGSDGIVAERSEPGFEAFYDQGGRDADELRPPQFPDSELQAAYEAARRTDGREKNREISMGHAARGGL